MERAARTKEQSLLGTKVRACRREQGLSQMELATRLGVSASYLNLIENNRRPLPASMLLKLVTEQGFDLQRFGADVARRLDADLLEVFADQLFEPHRLTNADVKELSAASPAAAQAVLSLYRAYKRAQESADSLAEKLHDDHDGEASRLDRTRSPSEDVNDFVQARGNHFPELEEVAERIWRDANIRTDDLYRGLANHLARAHGVEVKVVRSVDARGDGTLRRLDAGTRTLLLSELLPTRSRSFQLAHQLCLMEARETLDRLTADPSLATQESRTLARVALANYAAGAVMMPYEPVLRACQEERYDIDVVGRRFRVGFEQVAHRLTTLRRPGREGVPFHMLRIDMAGNISKRFSGSGIRFARFSGACPKWNVFAAFLTPGMIRVQISRMPDNNLYFCMARTIQKDSGGYHQQPPIQAIGLGCRLEHAKELTYAAGMDLENPAIIVPVGVTCRTCERSDCAQRALPSVRHPLHIDANVRRLSLYMGPGEG
jgi:predicted transcriptional regulator/DNA-binding XRE family transcriptional regulator